MLRVRSVRSLRVDPGWKSAEEVFSWWMKDDNIEGQISMFDDTE
nr:MAG TPA: hypothetical protein [Caudoviricetes sp.]